MQRYVAYLAGRAQDHILSHGLGDWYDIGPNRPGVAQLTPIALTATAIYYEDTQAMVRIADHLGKTDDGRRYADTAGQIKAAFHRRFFNAETGVYATGSQTAQAMPLVLGLVEPDRRAGVLDALVRDVQARGNGITAGDVGYRYVLRALADGGRSDVVFDMNHQSDKPGYGYQLAHGATSLTEAWNADRQSSQNHFMLGQIIEWFYHDLAGIQPDPAGPGFKKIVIRPALVPGLIWVKASYESPYGRISSAWRRDSDGRLMLDVTVPVNVTATIHVPAASPEAVTEGGRHIAVARGVHLLRQVDGEIVYELESGAYSFSVRP
jgi:alpha-L-rhamnosidase